MLLQNHYFKISMKVFHLPTKHITRRASIIISWNGAKLKILKEKKISNIIILNLRIEVFIFNQDLIKFMVTKLTLMEISTKYLSWHFELLIAILWINHASIFSPRDLVNSLKTITQFVQKNDLQLIFDNRYLGPLEIWWKFVFTLKNPNIICHHYQFLMKEQIYIKYCSLFKNTCKNKNIFFLVIIQNISHNTTLFSNIVSHFLK